MDKNILSLNEPVTFSLDDQSEIVENLIKKYQDFKLDSNPELREDEIEIDENMEIVQEEEMDPAGSESLEEVNSEISQDSDILTNEVFLNGVEQIINAIDGDSINEEVIYNDFGSVYSANNDLPDFSVVYQCDGVDVIFPTSYSEDLIIQDGMLINLGANYTAGATIGGANVNNYLSSEITIPTYHSSTWYQYMQTYGMPYRIVDRYVNNYGNISSTTRSSVDITWSGGNPWQGFTFDRAAMFIIIVILAVMLVFRKGSKV